MSYIPPSALSGLRSRGEMYISATAPTTINPAETYQKAAGTTTASELNDFDMPANNRLRYIGADAKKFKVSVALTQESTVNNVVARTRIAKGGTTSAKTQIDRKISVANDEGALPCQGVFDLAQNEFVELYVTADLITQLTVDHMNFIVEEV